MTWKEFKAELETRGVTDNMAIDYIDCHVMESEKTYGSFFKMKVAFPDTADSESGVRVW